MPKRPILSINPNNLDNYRRDRPSVRTRPSTDPGAPSKRNSPQERDGAGYRRDSRRPAQADGPSSHGIDQLPHLRED